jgi:hypothetical protein
MQVPVVVSDLRAERIEQCDLAKLNKVFVVSSKINPDSQACGTCGVSSVRSLIDAGANHTTSGTT